MTLFLRRASASLMIAILPLSCSKTDPNRSGLEYAVDFPQGFIAKLKPSLQTVKDNVTATRMSARKISQARPEDIDNERKNSFAAIRNSSAKLNQSIVDLMERLKTPGLPRNVAAEASIREEDIQAQIQIISSIANWDLPKLSESINSLSVQIAAKQPVIEAYDHLLMSIENINSKIDNVLMNFESWIGRFDNEGPAAEPILPGAFRDVVTGLDWKSIEQWPGNDELLTKCKNILGPEWRLATNVEAGNASSRLSDPTLNKVFTFNAGSYIYVATGTGQTYGYMIPSNRSLYNGNTSSLPTYCVKQSNQMAAAFKDTSVRSLWYWLGMWDRGSAPLDRCKAMGQGWRLPNRNDFINGNPRLTDAAINTAFKVNGSNYAYIASPDGASFGYGAINNDSYYSGEAGYIDLYCVKNGATELPVAWQDSVTNFQWVNIGKWKGEDGLKAKCGSVLGPNWKLATSSETQNAALRLTNEQINTVFKLPQGEYVYVSNGANVGYMTPQVSSSTYNGFSGTLTVLCNAPARP